MVGLALGLELRRRAEGMGICNPAKHRKTPHTSRQAQKDAQTPRSVRGGAAQGRASGAGRRCWWGGGRVRGFFQQAGEEEAPSGLTSSGARVQMIRLRFCGLRGASRRDFTVCLQIQRTEPSEGCVCECCRFAKPRPAQAEGSLEPSLVCRADQ